MNIALICCTYNRYTCLKRAIKCFLDQEIEDNKATLLIYNSSNIPIILGEFIIPSNKKIVIVNNTKDAKTGEDYTSVGAKYNDAINYAKTWLGDFDLFNSWDDDDLRLSYFIQDGIQGITKAHLQGKKAFKPKYSYFKYNGNIGLASNVMEPSIFVDFQHIVENGFLENSVKYHDGWLLPLVEKNEILVENTRSSFIYDWSGEIPVYKMSGRGEDTQQNFVMHKNSSVDTGNNVPILPITDEEMQRYYKEIEFLEVNQTN